MNENLRQLWSRSKLFRVVLIVAAVYIVLRLAGQGVYLAMMLAPAWGSESELPDWTEAQGPMVPADLQIYLTAAEHFQNREDLYLKGSLERLESHYPYAPSFAMAFIPFLWLSPVAVSIVHTVLHIVAYWLMYVRWGHIFEKFGFERANTILPWTIPVWLVFSAFWGDLGYLNIYIIMTLVGTFYIEAILDEDLLWSVIWLSVIIQIKPHWAFATAVPLLLGRWRFFIELMVWTVIVYALVFGAILLIAGPAYGWRQYVEYSQFLSRLSRDFPWRGPDQPFLGYNHSVVQIMVYWLGVTPMTMAIAKIVKVLLLIPFGVISLRYFLRPLGQPSYKIPQIALDFAFALYLGAFIWLDMVWEVSLGIAIFVYLLGTLKQHSERILVMVVFLPYALVDFWQFVSYAIFGMDIIAPGPYVVTDFSIYIPIIMIVIVAFYAVLLKRLWETFPKREDVVC